ncbi:sensor histidine kinase [Amycolatopsis sp. H20-H5]|uniref:sensor histidine kinase n=1 Tax=Amycolatopsis sp. H20-H5 TaxID=3046309 RepID=UPI002DBE22A1|nr:histidine kinase [Amycolatopsis sp. H20-H5]MEC3976816.1 histidine kinase [Amycolatopsis sp. H20-H5]
MSEDRQMIEAERPVRMARRYALCAFAATAAFLSMIPVAAMLFSWPGWGFGAPLLALLCAALALHCLRFREYLRRPGSQVSAPAMVMAVSVGFSLCVVGQASAWTGWAWAIVPALLLGDVVGGRSKRAITVWVTGATLLVFGSDLLVAPRIAGVPGWIGPSIAAFYISTTWASNLERNWWLGSLVKVDESRRIAAELAMTRERLRLADDLHDILGHALEVVAFKSELAARTVPSGVDGADRARREMTDAARVAREAMNEVRSLAADRRPTDLASELAGARAVLDSARVRLEVHGDPALVVQPLQDVLGRVLREAMTNLLRHSDATHCTITLGQNGGQRPVATLRVDDDGTGSAPSPEGSPSGSGLRSIERKLAPYAGTLSAGRREVGGFSLCVTVPVPRPGTVPEAAVVPA